MSTGSRTQTAFIQGNQSTADQDAPHPALLYLFQEVSRLASPIHDRGGPFVVKEDGDAQSFNISTSSCQHSLSCFSSYDQIEKVKQESHSSPWKVLSLINLQCERLLNPTGEEESSQSIKLGDSLENELTKETTEQGNNFLCEMHTIPDAHNISGSKIEEEEVPASFQPQPSDTEEEKFNESRRFSLKQCDNSFSSTGNIFNVLTTGNTTSSKVPFNSTEETSQILPKPALIHDHNANITFTSESQNDKELPSFSVVLSAAHSLLFDSVENGHSLSQQEDKHTAPTPDCSSDSGVHQEDGAALSAQTWRTKTPRKQSCPSKSIDIQDPDFQGVTFRMDTELDDTKEQCRLLITSKYSKEFQKSVRKTRLRTRTALKSLKTISSEEESDSATSASKGKVCASCCTKKTPMWRDAEDGTPLCNACGIRFKKYRVRCVNCWHIPRKESNSNSCCLKCGNSLKLTSAHRKHTA